MRKSKFLVFALVVAVMMMGAGYAYWSQDLAINNTVDTGILDVTFEEPANVIGEDNYQANADCTPDGYGMNVTWVDVYPGVQNILYFDLVNNGTLAAYVDNFAVTTTSAVDITDQILCKKLKVDGVEKTLPANATLADALAVLNDGNGILIEPQGDVNGKDKIKVYFELEFNSAATEADLPEDGLFTFTVESDVFQFNGR